MFTEFSIKNYRGFEKFEISGLRRVNIVTGLNGTGKTSILEIPFLIGGAGNSTLALFLHNLRGDSRLTLNSDQPFRDLFYKRQTTRPIEIRSVGDFKKGRHKARRVLRISALSGPGIKLGVSTAGELQGLSFDFEGPSGKGTGKVFWERSSAFVEGTIPQQLGSSLHADPVVVMDDLITGYFISPFQRDVLDQSHDQLVELVKSQRVRPVLDCLVNIEPRLRNLAPIAEDGRKNIYADIGEENLLPIQLLGAGFFNYLNVALDLFSSNNSILVIDEVESGLHYSIQKDYFKFMIENAIQRNYQLFLSTHSREALTALADACKELDFDDLALFRLNRSNQKALFATYDFNTFIDSFELHAELRG